MLKHTVIAIAAIVSLGCTGVPSAPHVIQKRHNVPVNIDSSKFKIPDEPRPSLSRDELKTLDEEGMIKFLRDYVHDLRGHIKVLTAQIKGIEKANNEMTERIVQENSK